MAERFCFFWDSPQ